MFQTIENLCDVGKKCLTAIGLAGLIGASSCIAYAKRDYDAYPDYKTEIALFNIQEIAKNACHESKVDKYDFSCKQFVQTVGSPPEEKGVSVSMVQTGQRGFCYEQKREINFPFGMLKQIEYDSFDIKFVLSNGHEYFLNPKDSRQAGELIEAFMYFKQEENQKENLKKCFSAGECNLSF